jgi:RimJ/RimL family protein N-acetyltransferase
VTRPATVKYPTYDHDVRMIRGEGIGLRVPVRADRERWLELVQDPEQRRFGTPVFVNVPETVEELDDRIAEASANFEAGEPTTLTIVEGDDPRFVGNIGWRRDSSTLLRICDIGYSVHPDSRGRGVARRAIWVFTRWLTLDDDGPRLARVQLDHSVENIASCRVALAAGFEREGVRRAYLPLPDAAAPGGVRRHDVCLHGLAVEA